MHARTMEAAEMVRELNLILSALCAWEEALVDARVAGVAAGAKSEEEQHCADQYEEDCRHTVHREMDRREDEHDAEEQVGSAVNGKRHEAEQAHFIVGGGAVEEQHHRQGRTEHAHGGIGEGHEDRRQEQKRTAGVVEDSMQTAADLVAPVALWGRTDTDRGHKRIS